jgi:hypothetical protein
MAKNLDCVVLLLVLGGLLGACSQTAEVIPPENAAETDRTSLNMLTDQEEAEGWQLLFDGTSMEHWRGFRLDSVPPGWEVQEGMLHFNADHGEEGYGDLTSRKEYANFELSLEWKTAPCGNSGVLFRVSEDSDQEWHSGPEVQIVDATEGCWSDYQAPEGERAPGSDLKASQLSGANYDLHAPAKDNVRPVGEWNHMRVVVDGPHVEQWLNGEKVVEYELWSDEWKQMVAESKFVEHPQYGMNKSGHIVLQDHGKSVWFRNLKIRELS